MTALTFAHATDLHPDGGIAFEHSVALARDARATLYSYHAVVNRPHMHRHMPNAQSVLAQWHGARALDLAIEHFKITHACCDDPVETLLDAMNGLKPDLMIMGTHQLTGLRHVMEGSVAESVANNISAPTLFLPIGKRGFVNSNTGAIELKRILVPVDGQESAMMALTSLRHIFTPVLSNPVDIVLLRVGSEPFPELLLPELPDTWRCTTLTRDKDLMSSVESVSEQFDIHLIAMATHGHDSLLDLLRGSQTERVVERSYIPVLSIPYAQS